MRISDWSSDVCSSDLAVDAGRVAMRLPERGDRDPPLPPADLLHRLVITLDDLRARLAPAVARAGLHHMPAPGIIERHVEFRTRRPAGPIQSVEHPVGQLPTVQTLAQARKNAR